MGYFNDYQIGILGEALRIAEESTGEYFKFSHRQWKNLRYDLKIHSDLKGEFDQDVFAILYRFGPFSEEMGLFQKDHFYFIYLQENTILNAIKRDRDIGLLPLLIYVLTHELVHIVRFCNFNQLFEVSLKRRLEEERIVHSITYDILKDISVPALSHVLDVYRDFRIDNILGGGDTACPYMNMSAQAAVR